MYIVEKYDSGAWFSVQQFEEIDNARAYILVQLVSACGVYRIVKDDVVIEAMEPD